MAELKDSGERRDFASGAVRDIQEGKGRCDLIPLDVVAKLAGDKESVDIVLNSINNFIYTGDEDELLSAIYYFCTGMVGWDIPTAILEVAKHYEDGANKYKERNWEKGIPLHCFIDSGVRHYLKYRRGDNDEPHNRAFVWNMLGAVWTYEHKPECIDLPFKDGKFCVPTETVDSDTLRNIIGTSKE